MIVYTADVFCDGANCRAWTNGVTSSIVPSKAEARHVASKIEKWTSKKGKDFCPKCAAKQGGN